MSVSRQFRNKVLNPWYSFLHAEIYTNFGLLIKYHTMNRFPWCAFSKEFDKARSFMSKNTRSAYLLWINNYVFHKCIYPCLNDNISKATHQRTYLVLSAGKRERFFCGVLATIWTINVPFALQACKYYSLRSATAILSFSEVLLNQNSRWHLMDPTDYVPEIDIFTIKDFLL